LAGKSYLAGGVLKVVWCRVFNFRLERFASEAMQMHFSLAATSRVEKVGPDFVLFAEVCLIRLTYIGIDIACKLRKSYKQFYCRNIYLCVISCLYVWAGKPF
jgi:hypothetical protein